MSFTDGCINLKCWIGAVLPDGYLIKWSSTSYAAISDPVDGTAEANGATTQNLTGRTAGTYAVTITDTHGCTKTATATITQPNDISVLFSVVNLPCYGGTDGAIDLTVSGGTPGVE